jgi:hypothetical protein
MAKLEKKELEFIEFLRTIGVLKDVDADYVKIKKEDGGEIIILCGDGKHFSDIYGHRIKLTKTIHPKNHKPHILSLNGGALRLSANSPLYNPIMAHDTLRAVLFNHINNIVLYGHVPCEAADFEDIDIQQNFELLIDGETVLQKLFEEIINNPESHFTRFLDKKTKNNEERKEKTEWIKKLFSKMKIKRYFHIDNNEDKKSYFVSLETWLQNSEIISKKWDELNTSA